MLYRLFSGKPARGILQQAYPKQHPKGAVYLPAHLFNWQSERNADPHTARSVPAVADWICRAFTMVVHRRVSAEASITSLSSSTRSTVAVRVLALFVRLFRKSSFHDGSRIVGSVCPYAYGIRSFPNILSHTLRTGKEKNVRQFSRCSINFASSAAFSVINAWSRPSIMTRTSGSVPDGRIRTRPSP